MAAQFFKDQEMTRDGFTTDWFLGAAFQMVPFGGSRPMSVITENTACTLFFETPSVAEMRNFQLNFVPQQGPQWGPTVSVDVPPNSTLGFFIHGKASGTVSLLLDDGTGAPPSQLWVNVKTALSKTCALLFLSDTVRSTARSVAEAMMHMQTVHDIFLQQANVVVLLQLAGSVAVPTNLGTPLLLDFKPVVGGPMIIQLILQATPPPALACDVRVYCCWDVATTTKPTLQGDTVNRSSFVEDGTDHLVFAHEVGHALMAIFAGKGYHNQNSNRLMFKSAPLNSTKLDAVEINTMNGSGL